MLIATHGGKFHADDAWAVAVLKVLFPDADVIRTREQARFDAADRFGIVRLCRHASQ